MAGARAGRRIRRPARRRITGPTSSAGSRSSRPCGVRRARPRLLLHGGGLRRRRRGSRSTRPIPLLPTNPYGETKLAFERALRWYAGAYGMRSIALRYFNAAGATDRSGERHPVETHLIPLVLARPPGQRSAITVFGEDYATPDGTCVRDYVHVSDLARAHVLALDALAAGGAVGELQPRPGRRGLERARSHRRGAPDHRPRDPREIGAAPAGRPRASGGERRPDPRELGWTPQRSALEEIVESRLALRVGEQASSASRPRAGGREPGRPRRR